MSKKSIFMIHGMSAGSWCWDEFKSFFTKNGYNCITPTLRHHEKGQKTPPPGLGKTSIRDYAEDLAEKIEKMEEKPILIGHSMGGLLSQILTSKGLSAKTVLIAPASPHGLFTLNLIAMKGVRSIFSKWGFWYKPFKQTYEEAVYSMLNCLPEEKSREVYDKFSYESGRALCEIGFWLFDNYGSTKVDESKVKTPMLILAGDKDVFTPPKSISKLIKKYKNAEYSVFKEHGHWMMQEPGWEKIAQHILDWIKNE